MVVPLAKLQRRQWCDARVVAVFNGNFFILTIYLQTTLRYSPLAAGLATLPVTLLMITLASRLGRFAARIGPRLPMTAGILLTGVGLGLLAFLQPGDSYLNHVLPGVVVFGVGLALTVPPLTNTAVSAVPDSQAGVASGVNDEAARVTALLGVAETGLVFATVFRTSLGEPSPSVQAYRGAMGVGVLIALAGSLVASAGIRNLASTGQLADD